MHDRNVPSLTERSLHSKALLPHRKLAVVQFMSEFIIRHMKLIHYGNKLIMR